MLITFLTILFTSLLAYSTVFGAAGPGQRHRLPQDRGRGARASASAAWFGYFFWVIGAFSLFAAALGIVDYTSRLAADVIKTSYRARTPTRASSTSAWSGAWSPIGIVVLLAGFDQPLVLLVISAVRRRLDDVHLLRPADPDQPQDPAGADPDPRRAGWPG